MPDVSTLSVKLSTVVAVVMVVASILGSWYSTNAKLTTATERIAALQAQVAVSQKANDDQHATMQAQAHEMELKLYGAITTLKLKRIME